VTTAVVYTLVPLVAVAASALVWQSGGSSAAFHLRGWSTSAGNGRGHDRIDLAGGRHHQPGRRTSSPTPTSSRTATASPTSSRTSSPTPTSASPSPVPTTTSPSPRSTTSSPTPTRSPTPSPTGSTPALPSGAFPNASTTGVPAGITLVHQSSTYYRVTTAGTVIDGYDFPGQLEVDADNVTIRNSRIHCSTSCVSLAPGHKGLRLSHDDIGYDSGWGSAPIGVLVGSTDDTPTASGLNVLEYLHIHNVGDGLRIDGDVTVRESYIHALDMTGDGAHSDGVQSLGGSHAFFYHNTIEGGNTSDFLVQGGNSNDWVIQSNLLLGRDAGAGGITSYAIGFDSASCPKYNCLFINNVLNRTWQAGPSYTPTLWTSASWYGNTYLDNGAIVPVPH
jgi:hypothetical protein